MNCNLLNENFNCVILKKMEDIIRRYRQLELLDRRKGERSHEYVKRVLTQNIMDWRLKPGEQIDEAQLCGLFQVSRTPIREALIGMKHSGLVDIYPQKGTYVSLLNTTMIEQTQYLRKELEPKLAMLACDRKTEEDIARFHENMALLRFYNSTNIDKQFSCDMQFHALVYKTCHMDYLQEVVSQASMHLDRMRKLCSMDRGYQNTIDDHQRILDAIESGNKDAAFSYMTIHLSTTLDDMALLKGKYPEYFE